MTNNLSKIFENLENEIIEFVPDEQKAGSSEWDEQTYFPDYATPVKSRRIETLQQQRMSEAFEESLKKDRQRRRLLFPVFLTGFLGSFGAAIACGVLWIGGGLTALEGLFYCVTSIAVMVWCMRRLWL